MGLLRELVGRGEPPFLPFSRSYFGCFGMENFVKFSRLYVEAFRPSSRECVYPCLPSTRVLRFQLPTTAVRYIVGGRNVYVRTVVFAS